MYVCIYIYIYIYIYALQTYNSIVCYSIVYHNIILYYRGVRSWVAVLLEECQELLLRDVPVARVIGGPEQPPGGAPNQKQTKGTLTLGIIP